MLDGRVVAFRRRGVNLSPPIVVADSWFGDSKLMRHVVTTDIPHHSCVIE
jgi:hypothetical protein